MLCNEDKPDILDLLSKIQEATTSDVDEERGSFKKGDKVTYNMLGGGLTNSDLVKMLGANEHATRVNHNGTPAEIVEAIGDEVSRYSIQFEDGFVITDVAVSELKSIVDEKKELSDKEVAKFVSDQMSGTKGEDVIKRTGDLLSAFIKKFHLNTETAGKAISKLKAAVAVYKSIGNESKTNEAEDATQTMKPQEKPDINAEDYHMEDYSDEDLNKPEAKVVSKSEKSGDAIRKVEDKELEQEDDEVVEPKNESKIEEVSQSEKDEFLKAMQSSSWCVTLFELLRKYPKGLIINEILDWIGYDRKRTIVSLLEREIGYGNIRREEEKSPKGRIRYRYFLTGRYKFPDDEVVEPKNEPKVEEAAAKRSRGDAIFQSTHPKVKDNADHFPINDADQARNALARASQYSAVPKWYDGSLDSLVKTVASAVKKKYPSIEVTKAAKKPGKDGKNESKLEEQKNVLGGITGGEDEGKPGIVKKWVLGLGYQDVSFEGKTKQISYEYLEVAGKSAEEFEASHSKYVEEAVATKDEVRDKVIAAYKKYRETGKSREEAVQRTKKDFEDITAPEIRNILDIEGVKESNFSFMKKQKPLWLCNECYKTFRADEHTCIFCDSTDADKIGEGYGDLAGSTKEVFKVTWKTEDGKEESTRVMAFDKDAAKREQERNPNRKVTKVEGPITSESEKENKAPFEQVSEGSKLQESVSELIGETPGIDIEDQKILRWAIEKNVVSNEWPSDEAMIDQLSTKVVPGTDMKDPEGLDLGEIEAVYLKYILLPKATTAYAKSVSEAETNQEKVTEITQEGIPKAGKTYHIRQTLGRGWKEGDYRVTDVQFLRSARGDLAKQFQVEGNDNWWIAEFYHFEEVDKTNEVKERDRPTLKQQQDVMARLRYRKSWYKDLSSEEKEEVDFRLKDYKLKEQEDTLTVVGKGLAKEDAEKLAIDKDGQVITDEEDEKKFAVIVKGE